LLSSGHISGHAFYVDPDAPRRLAREVVGDSERLAAEASLDPGDR
jgi:hypothetical protein